MKITLFALPLLLAPLAAAPAFAQDDVVPEEAAAELTIDSPIEVLMADEGAREIVLAEIPSLDEHPAYGQFKAMSLTSVQPFSQGMITDEMLTNIGAGLAELD